MQIIGLTRASRAAAAAAKPRTASPNTERIANGRRGGLEEKQGVAGWLGGGSTPTTTRPDRLYTDVYSTLFGPRRAPRPPPLAQSLTVHPPSLSISGGSELAGYSGVTPPPFMPDVGTNCAVIPSHRGVPPATAV